jgi:PAS domain S-box-containing protein
LADQAAFRVAAGEKKKDMTSLASPKTTISLALLVALLIGNAFLAYTATRQVHANAGWVTHTHRAMDALTGVLTTLLDAETGQRGYLISGSAAYLEPYDNAMARLEKEVRRLKELTRDNAAQEQHLSALQPLIAERLAILKKVIEVRKKSGLDAAREVLMLGEGKRVMDAIRLKVAQMRSVEEDLLQVHAAAAQRSYRLALLSGGIAALLGIGLALLSAYFFLRDVRTRERARVELQEQKEWFSTTLSSIGDAVIVTDAAGRVSFMNQVARTLTGWTSPDAAGHPLAEVFQIINEETRHPAGDPVARVIETGTIAGLANHTVLVARNGKEMPIDDSAAPIRGADGKILGVVLVFRDITERRGAEAALLASERQLRLITDTAPVYLARVDTEHRYLFVNKGYAERFGLDRDAVIGKRIPEVVGEAAYATFKSYVDQVLAGEKVEFEIAIPYEGIGTHYMQVTYVPDQDERGRVQGLVAVIMDISARKRAEDQLRLADRRKDEFLAMLGHELRNPLAPIRTAVEILRRVGPTEPRLERARAIIDRQVAHLTRLVDDLLDVSRITQGKIALQTEVVELAPAIQHALETARPLINARGQVLVVDMPRKPLYVNADAVRLAQVFGNLLNNAAKYTKEGGRIEVSVEIERQTVVVRVRDDGTGISAELLPHVFDLFTQAERDADLAQGGLGIGLTLVRRLLELQGGSVRAESAGPGKGSEFSVELPLVAAPTVAAAAHAGDAVAQANAQRKILVVDDNVDSAESLALMLELEGHQLRIAHDGETALNIARAFQPHVVLLDIGLPGLNGYQVAEQLRAAPQTHDAKLVAVTGYGQPEDERRAKDAGFDHYLVKPIDLGALDALLSS